MRPTRLNLQMMIILGEIVGQCKSVGWVCLALGESCAGVPRLMGNAIKNADECDEAKDILSSNN